MKMNATLENTRCAVCLPDDENDRLAVVHYLEQNGLSDAVEFHLRDDEKLYAEIQSGRFDRVVFPDLESLLTVLWNNESEMNWWAHTTVRVELADCDVNDSVDWMKVVQTFFDSTKGWRARRRRRQIIASIILAMVGLIAMIILFLIIPPAT